MCILISQTTQLINTAKGNDNSFNSSIDEKDIVYISECFPKCKANVKIGLDLSNYLTKENFKNATDVDTSKFPRKVNLTNLKSESDK